jgi:hypothetical protein
MTTSLSASAAVLSAEDHASCLAPAPPPNPARLTITSVRAEPGE